MNPYDIELLQLAALLRRKQAYTFKITQTGGVEGDTVIYSVTSVYIKFDDAELTIHDKFPEVALTKAVNFLRSLP